MRAMSSAIIHDLYVNGTLRPGRPLEADAPLVIDSNAVLTFPIALERFEPAAGQRSQVLERRGGFQLVQSHFSSTGKTLEGLNTLTGGKVARSLVAIAQNHQDI